MVLKCAFRSILIFAAVFLIGCPQPHFVKKTFHKPIAIRGTFYRVQKGDSLKAIAERKKLPLSDIEELNGIDHRNPLAVGKVIFVPNLDLKNIQREFPIEEKTNYEKGKEPKIDLNSKGSLIWPVPKGRLSSRFGRRGHRIHEGIDIAAAKGSAVIAAAIGEVIYSGSGIKGYGNMIIIKHSGHLVTVYAHNEKNLVSDGQTVRTGEVIAQVGRSGRATGYHLHFEVRKGETPIDPLPMLKRIQR